jgi:hypothetical protein
VDITPTNDNSKEKKSSPNTELPSYDTRSSTADDGSTRKKKMTTDISISDRTIDDDKDSKDKKNKSTDTIKLDTTPTINSDGNQPDMTSSTFSPSIHQTEDSTSTDTIITGTINSDSGSIDTNTTTTTDEDSTGKSTADSYATTGSSGSTDNGNSNPNFSTTNDGNILSSYLASAIKNKVNSIIRNGMGGIIDTTPFLLPFH